MHNPILSLFGYKILHAEITYATKIFNLCQSHGIAYRNQTSNGKSIALECSLLSAAKLIRLCEKHDIPLVSVSSHGFPIFLYSYRKRYGLLIGTIISLVLIFASGGFLWNIQVDGESRLSEKQVIDELYACGLYVGMPLSRIDADVIQNKMIIYSEDVSWISINLSGTVARVEIRETEKRPVEKEKPTAANLIATNDGEIVGFEEVRGDISVNIGDIVRAGELLVSGIRDSKTLGFTYTCADGKVFAKVKSDNEVSVPLEYDKKVYSEKIYVEKYLVFFNKEIKIYSNNNKSYESCDIIDTIEYANPFYLGELPFGIRSVLYLPYRYERATRSTEEAIDLALYQLRTVEEEKGICDILSKQLEGEFSNGAYHLRATTTSLKNIAKQVAIDIKN